ncbi:MAG: EFR1 family ferrodoxin [Desulfobacteraceae bacterium]|nr:EFR1 family ferrodoxin [Desulfobacteraceae bacterium]
MNIKNIKLVYFSPTQTTKKVVEGIAEGMDADNVEHIDLTLPNNKAESIKFSDGNFLIFGMPVYGGRIPARAVGLLERFKGENTMAAVVVVYGNRAYEDALLELKDITIRSGFKPIAAGAFVGEHSFSKKEFPIAEGRPDKEDLSKAAVFGKSILDKIQKSKSIDDIAQIDVPGNFPYKEGMTPSKAATSTENDICTMCETCATVCPTGAITYEDEVITDNDKCILCCACVKNCPTEARGLEVPPLLEKIKQMSENLSEQKSAELFI